MTTSAGLLDVAADQLVEAGDALHPLGQPATAKTFAVLVLHVHVVVGLSPVHPYKDHLAPPLVDRHHHRARGPQQPPNGPVLEARHPTSRQRDLTDQQGHDLDVGLKALDACSAHLLAAQLDQPHLFKK